MQTRTKQALTALGAIGFVAAVAVAGAMSGWGPPLDKGATGGLAVAAAIHAGQKAPDFTVRTLDGRSVSLASLRGKPVMLDFWATWCGPCVESLPETAQVAADYRNVTVLAISMEDRGSVEAFAKQHHLNLEFCVDKDGTANDAYGIEAIPCRVFIGADGKVADCLEGSGQEDEVAAALKKIGAVSRIRVGA